MSAVMDDPAKVAAKVVSPLRWLLLMFGMVGLVFLINLGIAWKLDPFGVFRSTRGRALIASEDERQAKFLLNQEYVPENFNALILGASGSVNWRTDLLTGYRFYNESIFGGDGSEERYMVEQAMRKGQFKVALVGFHPLITARHDLQDGLDNITREEALGSVASIRIELERIRNHFKPDEAYYQPDGGRPIVDHLPFERDAQGTLTLPPLDPQAVRDYGIMVEELQSHGVKVIYIHYPLYEPHYQAVRGLTDAYFQHMLSNMPLAPVLDFNDAADLEFREDMSNFIDEVHLSSEGSEKLTKMINTRMHSVLKDQ